MNHIKIISQKNILKTNLFDIEEVELETETGSKHTHINVARRPAVSVFPITESYEIYLVSQYRYSFRKNIIESVSGFIDKDEKPIDAAKRELSEETGLSAQSWIDMGATYMSASVIQAIQYLFVAKEVHEGIAHPEETEDIRLIKIPLSEAVRKIMSGEINTAATRIGIFMLDKLRLEGKI